MPRTENTECSLISPAKTSFAGSTTHRQQMGRNGMLLNTIKVLPAHLLSRTAYLRIAKERTTVGGVIAMADWGSIAEKKANFVRRAILPSPP